MPRPRALIFTLLLAVCLAIGQTARPPARATLTQFEQIRKYIKESWRTLTRSNANLAAAAVDPKFKPGADGKWPVYVSNLEDQDAVVAKLRSELPPADFAKITVTRLGGDPAAVKPGLLYLPYPYVVPGGRFNEMYGWDSYFIQVGLVQDQEFALAKNLTDNFLYEILNYGKILNANRTYYLTRSQPPFLTQMILAVYRHSQDKNWLAAAVPEIEAYYRFWTTPPHITDTGLSRYYDFGDGPAPESLSDEKDEKGRTHYDLVKEYFRTHNVTDYDARLYYDREKNELTDLFYKGDRSMRESGFDPSNRFGPFSADIIHYNPVCLNSLLYLMEKQTAEIMTILDSKQEASEWEKRASDRAKKMEELMWDEKDGFYYDYNYVQKKTRHYPFLTTFYPLWAGIADKERAARVVANLGQFERPGGLQTSTLRSGNQWDSPFGWAPLEMIAIEGMRQYGFTEPSDRVSAEFLSLVLKSYLQSKTIVEKYDVVRRATDVSSSIGFGYRTNVVGFGWTNAAFLQIYAGMTGPAKPNVLKLEWPAAAAATAK